MCGRYYIASEDADEQIRQMIDEMNRRESEKGSGKAVKTGEIFPSDDALVVANSRVMNPRPFLMKWGFFTESGKRPLINARSESALEKPTFRDLVKNRRLIVPATRYCEWQSAGSQKEKYEFTYGKQSFCMAGLYRMNPDGQFEFVILTREASPYVAMIHNRMPVIFSWKTAYEWLKPQNAPEQMLKDAVLNMDFQRCAVNE